MSEEGIVLFQEKYPGIYAAFKPVIDKAICKGEKRKFFSNLTLVYGLTGNQKVDFNKCLITLRGMSLGKKHSFFDFLITYLPNNPLSPPCMGELEEALTNANISFENKPGTLKKLRESSQFWGKYCELEAAANFAKAGCKVKVLHKVRSNNKYPDLEVMFHSFKINVEVSNRLYKINKNSAINALRNKVVNEAAQLPADGFNIILFFVSDSLMFSGNVNPGNSVNVFSFTNALFDPGKASILDTNAKLKHIKGLFIWFHGQVYPKYFGKQTRMLIPYVRKDFPKEAMCIFCNIQLADIKKEQDIFSKIDD